MERKRVVKFVATVEITREDWGVKVTHPALGLVASGKTEDEALDKMDKAITQKIETDLVHGTVRSKAKSSGR
jgi:predicted RNase H-like HicB family nuclease